MSDPDCIFCKIVAGEIPSAIVDEDESTLAFMDINPATRGHLLVIPREHAKDLLEIDPEDLAATARAAQRMARRASERLNPAGVNLINSAIAAVNGDLSKKDDMRRAMEKADFKSVRGNFKFGNNHVPIQNFYLQETVKQGDDYVLRTVSTIVENDQDRFHDKCPMKLGE